MNSASNVSLHEEQRAKITEVRTSLGSLPDILLLCCSDASIARCLAARNWNVKKATKMLKETLKWRLQYKPEEIRWEEVAKESETGKIYRSKFFDKYGRSILVMRPGCQNTKSTKGQIRYLVYCMENAILNLPAGQDQMVWLIDFHGFNMSNISVKVTKETAHVLQDHYPERLGVAILYNPPKIFESFWTVVKPFLEPKTYRKVRFVYSNDPVSKKIMEELFNMDELERSFGGNNPVGFNINDYAERMREDDKRMPLFWTRENTSISSEPSAAVLNLDDPEADSDESNEELQDDLSAVKLEPEGSESSIKEENGRSPQASNHLVKSFSYQLFHQCCTLSKLVFATQILLSKCCKYQVGYSFPCYIRGKGAYIWTPQTPLRREIG